MHRRVKMTLVGVFAAIASIVGAFAALLIVAVFSRPPIDGRPFRELSNLRHLGIATMLYANDNDDRFPPADTWEESLRLYQVDAVITESLAVPGKGRAYAMNGNLSHRAKVRDPDTVLFFECEPGAPLSGGRELLPSAPRYPGGYLVIDVNLNSRMVPADQLEMLKWEP